MRYTLFLILLIAPLTALCQQRSDSQTAADSLVKHDDNLFEDITPPPDSVMRENESKPKLGRFPNHRDPEFSFRFERPDLLGLNDRHLFFIRYNRADGFYLGAGGDSPSRLFIEQRTQAYFGFGYAFGSHYWQVYGGVKRDFLNPETPLRFSAEGHIITDTKDAWKMDGIENSIFSFFDGIDVRDYFQRKGFSVSLQQFFSPRTVLKAEFRRDNYTNSIREVGFSLFGPHQPFREVPPIREGPINSVVLNFLADDITFRTWSDPQFGVEAQSEFGFGDYSFAQHVLDTRLKTTIIPHSIWIALRGRLGSATGNAPPQKLFTIGGFGTLPGYPQNAYEGNRMLLVQSDLLIAPFSTFLKDLRIIISNDFGAVTITGSTSAIFGGFAKKASEFKYSPGIYLGSPTGAFRIGAAWRTDGYATPTFIVRLAKPF